MIDVVAIQNYRALRDICFEPGPLTLITGENGSGKSSLYRALTLLQRAANGGLGLAIAREGGLDSITWAGVSERASRAAIRRGEPIRGVMSSRKDNSRITLGLRTGGCGFELELGMPEFAPDSGSMFARDPGVVRETVWVGESRTRYSTCLRREGRTATSLRRDDTRELHDRLALTESVLSQLRGPGAIPELALLRESLLSWRFYDTFGVHAESPLRRPAIGVRSPALASDGANLAACIQTLFEVGDGDAFQRSVHAGLGAEVEIDVTEGPRFELTTRVPGVLRPMRAHELSDGTLRYIAIMAALHAPRRAPVVVLNEPESSLHPSLLAPLAAAIAEASTSSQTWVVTHSPEIARALRDADEGQLANVELERAPDGAAVIRGQTLLSRPAWS